MTTAVPAPEHRPSRALLARGILGGALMGLANLVPGISGGTMLLASGIYRDFVTAIAELSTLHFRRRSLLVLGAVGFAAMGGILLFAGPVKDLVVNHRWVMYSLFIGLTLGGMPLVWRLARTPGPALWGGAAAGFSGMVLLVMAQGAGAAAGDTGQEGVILMFLAGLAGASAMILPGVSGGYLLLVMGQYVPILSAIDAVKHALGAGHPAAAVEPALSILLPVAVGVVAGVVGVSNLLRWFFTRFEQATLGVLLGLLAGAVVGLWPFQHPVAPVPGQTVIKGRLVTGENLAEFKIEDFPTAVFRPSAGQMGSAAGLIFLGAAATLSVARLGRDEDQPAD